MVICSDKKSSAHCPRLASYLWKQRRENLSSHTAASPSSGKRKTMTCCGSSQALPLCDSAICYNSRIWKSKEWFLWRAEGSGGILPMCLIPAEGGWTGGRSSRDSASSQWYPCERTKSNAHQWESTERHPVFTEFKTDKMAISFPGRVCLVGISYIHPDVALNSLLFLTMQ